MCAHHCCVDNQRLSKKVQLTCHSQHQLNNTTQPQCIAPCDPAAAAVCCCDAAVAKQQTGRTDVCTIALGCYGCHGDPPPHTHTHTHNSTGSPWSAQGLAPSPDLSTVGGFVQHSKLLLSVKHLTCTCTNDARTAHHDVFTSTTPAYPPVTPRPRPKMSICAKGSAPALLETLPLASLGSNTTA